ncbi:MAG: ATP-binding cassette domain-containing protein, partial [Myxococcota bacterium]
GAGKTTFINMVTGYIPPSAGQIFFRGRDITGLSPRRVAKAGVCRSFQVSQLFGELTAVDNVVLALGMAEGRLSWLRPLRTPQRYAAATEVLARFTIETYAQQVVDSLPQGVKKLLDIAMAVARTPDLLLLDEPTSGVAIEEKMGIMETIMTPIRASGAACLFVEHDMEVVEKYADRVIVFFEGRVLADGPVEQVLADREVQRHVLGSSID